MADDRVTLLNNGAETLKWTPQKGGRPLETSGVGDNSVPEISTSVEDSGEGDDALLEFPKKEPEVD